MNGLKMNCEARLSNERADNGREKLENLKDQRMLVRFSSQFWEKEWDRKTCIIGKHVRRHYHHAYRESIQRALLQSTSLERLAEDPIEEERERNAKEWKHPGLDFTFRTPGSGEGSVLGVEQVLVNDYIGQLSEGIDRNET